MTLQQLKYVIKIAECGSITDAAEKLFISQPSLSNSVKELEKEFGIDIFRRTARGVTLTADGLEFLAYAREVEAKSTQLLVHFKGGKNSKRQFSVSSHHYAFAVTAFANVIKILPSDEYEFTLRETRTYEIIDDVASFRSEVGVLYVNDFNRKILQKLFRERHVVFYPIFKADAHVFLSARHPLAKMEEVTLEDLADYPFLSFEQGAYNSFYFSEEILSAVPRKKTIHVTDRATLFNLAEKLKGYTICSGILNNDLNGSNIVAVKLKTDEDMEVGWIQNSQGPLSSAAHWYICELKRLIYEYGYKLIKI